MKLTGITLLILGTIAAVKPALLILVIFPLALVVWYFASSFIIGIWRIVVYGGRNQRDKAKM